MLAWLTLASETNCNQWLANEARIMCTGLCMNQDLPVKTEYDRIGLLLCGKQFYNHWIQPKANLHIEIIHLHLISEHSVYI